MDGLRRSVTYLQLLTGMRDRYHCCPWGKDSNKPQPSNGELKRWILDKAVIVGFTKEDGTDLMFEAPERWDEPVPLEVEFVVYFPKGKMRTTIPIPSEFLQD